MEPALLKLLRISSEAIVALQPDRAQMAAYLRRWAHIGKELEQMLAARNGFWAFESSLLVRPFYNETAPLGLLQWNEKQLWKGSYSIDLDHVLFFAEDAFGCQHCLVGDTVSVFDPETGQFEGVASSLQGWAEAVIGDYEYRTGYPLAHAWQIQNHPLQPGTRLLPNIPFVLGGKYELKNLHISNEVEGMIFRASIANQIRDVPDGCQVVLELVNKRKK